MRQPRRPATIVVCAAAPRLRPAGGDGAWLRTAQALPVPVTWIAGADRLAEIGRQLSGPGPAPHLAIDVPPAVCGSRQKLRDLLGRVRDAVPGLTAVVLRGPTPPANRMLLVEWNIGVALVDAFDGGERGSRRPAPRGWPCRNAVWGLWEVLATPYRPRGIAGWLGFTTMPRLAVGGLHVASLDREGATEAGSGLPSGRLERWAAWAARRARDGAVVTSLPQLPERLGRDARIPLAGSVLRAA